MALELVSASSIARIDTHTAASLRSLIGMPIVLVIVAVQFAISKTDLCGFAGIGA